MQKLKQCKTELIQLIHDLPDEKIIELFDFARFLVSQYSKEEYHRLMMVLYFFSNRRYVEYGIILRKIFMNYNNGDIVIVPFPFVTSASMQQKARPALVISNHNIKRKFDDFILIAITSQNVDTILSTEYLIEEGTEAFKQSGLVKKSVVRCEYIMTVPNDIIVRKIGLLPVDVINEINEVIKLSLGLK